MQFTTAWKNRAESNTVNQKSEINFCYYANNSDVSFPSFPSWKRNQRNAQSISQCVVLMWNLTKLWKTEGEETFTG